MPRRAFCSDAGPDGPYPASEAAYDKASRVIPGGHHLAGRPWLTGGRAPLFFARGKGCVITDVDGRTYRDFGMALGPAILGYADDSVDAAVAACLADANVLTLNTPLPTRFAEAVLAWLPAAEMALPFKSGSDATTAALRIARRYTGRRKVAVAGYVGWHDWCLAGADYVPVLEDGQVLRFDANAPDTLECALRYGGNDVAAVILAAEEVRGASRQTFVELMELAHRWGAVFILDEIKTGIRTVPGTLQQRLGLAPDLTTLSKALGNGYSVAAVAGRREVMSAADGLHLSGTFHCEAVGLTAALATLQRLSDRAILHQIWKLGERMIDGLNVICQARGVPAFAAAEPLPPMPMLRFAGWPEHRLAPLRERFFEELYRHGVLCNPRHVWFISAAHTAADINAALDAAEQSMNAAMRETVSRRPTTGAKMRESVQGEGADARIAVLRAGIIGCGQRAHVHAAAYAGVDRARITAVCDLDAERAESFAAMVDADSWHDDVAALLSTAPDIIHVLVPPTGRADILAACLAAKPKAIILEKPVATDVSDLRIIDELAAHAAVTIVANTQLRFQPRLARLIASVRAGEIGELRSIDASCLLPIAEQGSHLIDLAAALTNESPVATVFGHATGVAGVAGSHPGPDQAIADIAFASGVRLHLSCGANAPRASGDARAYRHKLITAHGTRGFMSWSMQRWELSTAQGYESGTVDYAAEDLEGQAALVNAAVDCAFAGGRPHPTRLSIALPQAEAVLAIYASALSGGTVALPLLASLEADLIPRLVNRELMMRALFG
nr:aminotransferase class III-fold pyridoxal phosphate-dependent enzyme [Bradyrhizobium sp. SZCCHNS3051]